MEHPYSFIELQQKLPPEFNANARVWIHKSNYDELLAKIAALEVALRDALTYIEKPEWRALVGFAPENEGGK